ncbi:MAG: 50S ribosomal protein L11 methyltransferase [Oscillospiraceae bacterium]|nr:50S ribosomal protein L11 methyltransferase [Oscillospiraceae bacterium]
MTNAEKREKIKERLLAAPNLSNRELARAVGCSHTSVAAMRRILEESGKLCHGDTTESNWLNHPLIKGGVIDLSAYNVKNLQALKTPGVLDKMMRENLTSPVYAQRKLRQEAKQARKNTPIGRVAENIKIFKADIHNGLPEVESESVTLLITDPPYQKSALSLYKSLGMVAGRVLREGGSLLCMTGSSHLPEVIQALQKNDRLKWHWLIAYHTPASAPMLEWKRVSPFVKYFLWFTKGEYRGDWQSDYIRAPGDKSGDKTYHVWGQNVAVQKTLIEKFSDPGELVLDCFLGGGSSAVAAAQLGTRRFLGTDIDPVCVRKSKQRVEETLTNNYE